MQITDNTCKLTTKIINNLTNIERIYGQLEGMCLPQKLQLNLERDNLVQSTYISNSIEGNPLSLNEVTNLLLGDRMPTNRDEKEVYNYFNILKDLNVDKNVISIDFILNIHKKLLTGVKDEIAGVVRNKRVVVGGYKDVDGELELHVKHEPPTHQETEIKKMLTKLCDWYNSENSLPTIVKIAIFHHRFVYIHPFIDGNGRTCRLITAKLFLNAEYEINKYFVLDDYYDIDRKLYSDVLSEADKGRIETWVEYFTDGVKYSLMTALSNAKNAIEKSLPSERLSPKEAEVLEIIKQRIEVTSADIAGELQVSRQQAHKLLSALVVAGYVSKSGNTKQSIYKLL